jgi:hypothetical protein
VSYHTELTPRALSVGATLAAHGLVPLWSDPEGLTVAGAGTDLVFTWQLTWDEVFALDPKEARP